VQFGTIVAVDIITVAREIVIQAYYADKAANDF
jgi:uncharacterized membrane protein (DUF373 family)